MRIKPTGTERLFHMIVILVMCAIIVITVYPFIYVLSVSISEPANVMQGKVWLLPVGFSLESYKLVLKDPEIWTSYYNTIWYTVIGTAINMAMTLLAAYPLSKKKFCLRVPLTFFFLFTMFFSGGLIPLFILVKNLGLYNTRWALVLVPVGSFVYYMLVTITFLHTIPDSLQESARIDGANDILILLRIVVPLSLPVIAVISLFFAVYYWNSYMPALLYISDTKLKPLQIYLVKIVINNNYKLMEGIQDKLERSSIGSQLKYAVIIFAVLPIVCVYPFLQKYFVKGVMIGAIKE